MGVSFAEFFKRSGKSKKIEHKLVFFSLHSRRTSTSKRLKGKDRVDSRRKEGERDTQEPTAYAFIAQT